MTLLTKVVPIGRALALAAALGPASGAIAGARSPVPRTPPFVQTALSLTLTVDYERPSIEGTTTLTIVNVGGRGETEVPLLLNRLMAIRSVTDQRRPGAQVAVDGLDLRGRPVPAGHGGARRRWRRRCAPGATHRRCAYATRARSSGTRRPAASTSRTGSIRRSPSSEPTRWRSRSIGIASDRGEPGDAAGRLPIRRPHHRAGRPGRGHRRSACRADQPPAPPPPTTSRASRCRSSTSRSRRTDWSKAAASASTRCPTMRRGQSRCSRPRGGRSVASRRSTARCRSGRR